MFSAEGAMNMTGCVSAFMELTVTWEKQTLIKGYNT